MIKTFFLNAQLLYLIEKAERHDWQRRVEHIVERNEIWIVQRLVMRETKFENLNEILRHSLQDDHLHFKCLCFKQSRWIMDLYIAICMFLLLYNILVHHKHKHKQYLFFIHFEFKNLLVLLLLLCLQVNLTACKLIFIIIIIIIIIINSWIQNEWKTNMAKHFNCKFYKWIKATAPIEQQ